jgi:uncharacterized membrane-anchored protein YitT (DUF2179 family)
MKILKTYFLITFGLFLNAFGWTAFLIPAKIVGGGVTGVSSLVFFSTGLPVGVTVLILNAVLIAAAAKILGRSFGIKTVYGVIIHSILLTVLQWFIHAPIVKDAFMATIFGGAFGGVGIGIVFGQGGSSGGTDILILIINKYKNLSPGKLLLFTDSAIVLSSYLITGSIEKIVYGFVVLAVTSYSLDMMLEGFKQSMQIFIFSNKYQEIADRIGTELHRGITFINGRGWYTSEEKQILMIIVKKYEINTILRLIKEVDKDSFLSITSVMGVFGKGFDTIRH